MKSKPSTGSGRALALTITTAVAIAFAVTIAQPKPLTVNVIDVEGGQATLFVSPAGESMLVDTGWPGFDGRDADRIAAAVKRAGLDHIDYLVITHYHRDHGPSVETDEAATALFNAYVEARKTGKHLQVKPGDTIPVKGIDVRVTSAGGELITQPLAGGGAANPMCESFKPRDPDPTENARSVGVAITYGSFRMLDLGDLTWNKEKDLVCPKNLLGTFDVYLTTHHGSDQSGPAVLVHAIKPRVALMNNGAKKGGSKPAWTAVHESPGLQDFWQVHTAVDAGSDHNSPAPFVANVDESTAFGLTVAAQSDGSFTVTNERTKETRRYGAGGR